MIKYWTMSIGQICENGIETKEHSSQERWRRDRKHISIRFDSVVHSIWLYFRIFSSSVSINFYFLHCRVGAVKMVNNTFLQNLIMNFFVIELFFKMPLFMKYSKKNDFLAYHRPLVSKAHIGSMETFSMSNSVLSLTFKQNYSFVLIVSDIYKTIYKMTVLDFHCNNICNKIQRASFHKSYPCKGTHKRIQVTCSLWIIIGGSAFCFVVCILGAFIIM